MGAGGWEKWVLVEGSKGKSEGIGGVILEIGEFHH